MIYWRDESGRGVLNDDDQRAVIMTMAVGAKMMTIKSRRLPGQLAVDVHETEEHLQARTAWVNKDEPDAQHWRPSNRQRYPQKEDDVDVTNWQCLGMLLGRIQLHIGTTRRLEDEVKLF